MTEKVKLLPKNRKMLEQFKIAARERILKREFVQFRVDDQMMDLLTKVANHRRQPLGVMVRDWVANKLSQEAAMLPLPKVKLPDGKTLSEKSAQPEIEKVVFAYQNGRIKLSDKEYRTLMDWLLDRHLANKYAFAATSTQQILDDQHIIT